MSRGVVLKKEVGERKKEVGGRTVYNYYCRKNKYRQEFTVSKILWLYI